MTTETTRPAPRQTDPFVDADAATAILRMLTADRIDPSPCCRADGIGSALPN